MASENAQANRIGRLVTPLGGDALVLVSLTGFEAMDDLFEFTVNALASPDIPVDTDRLLGRHCSIALTTITGSERWFDGIVTAVSPLGASPDGGQGFRIELRPWLWFLSMRSRSRIFHNLSPPQIIEQVLAEYSDLGSPLQESRLSETYPALEYTVQYRESDLDFVRRIAEEYGISFHFEMDEGNHCLVLSDHSNAFQTIPDGTRPFRPVEGQMRAEIEHFEEWVERRQITPGAVRLGDYDFKRPRADLTVEQAMPAGHENAGFEMTDHPGRYVEAEAGRLLVRRRLDGFRTGAVRVEATGDVLSLAPGHKVEVTEHAEADRNGSYVGAGCWHSFSAESYRSGEGGGFSYQGRYELVSSHAPLAPRLRTPRARVAGPLTATVIGTGEIDTDEFGRILVRFHWDEDAAGSMRCRVAQSWAGNRWGTQFIPRVGMEVVVEFLDGDPDRPLVTGAVYNGANPPPFGLPADKTISGWKSYSSPGGKGYNRFSFEDRAGAEAVDLHAQKDLRIKVLNDERREIGQNRSEELGGSDSLKITGSRQARIEGEDSLKVAGKITIASETAIRLEVGQSFIEIDGMSITLSAANIKLDARMDLSTAAGLTASHTASGPMTIRGVMVLINS